MFDGFEQQRYTQEELETMSGGEIFRDAFSEAFPPWQLIIVPAVGSIWFAAELATMLSNPRRRALHDVIGASVVIKAPKTPRHSGPTGLSPRPPAISPEVDAESPID
jgi:hypothetical protein